MARKNEGNEKTMLVEKRESSNIELGSDSRRSSNSMLDNIWVVERRVLDGRYDSRRNTKRYRQKMRAI